MSNEELQNDELELIDDGFNMPDEIETSEIVIEEETPSEADEIEEPVATPEVEDNISEMMDAYVYTAAILEEYGDQAEIDNNRVLEEYHDTARLNRPDILLKTTPESSPLNAEALKLLVEETSKKYNETYLAITSKIRETIEEIGESIQDIPLDQKVMMESIRSRCNSLETTYIDKELGAVNIFTLPFETTMDVLKREYVVPELLNDLYAVIKNEYDMCDKSLSEIFSYIEVLYIDLVDSITVMRQIADMLDNADENDFLTRIKIVESRDKLNSIIININRLRPLVNINKDTSMSFAEAIAKTLFVEL